jgi:effector-binding domain-containing protein
MSHSDVEVKTVASQRVLGLRTTISENSEEPDVEGLFERVIEFMDAVEVDRASPISWRDHDDKTVHIHAGYFPPTDGVPGLEVFELPPISAASVVRRGAVDGINEAHQAIARRAEAHHHTPSVERGRWRELCLETC